MLPCSCSWWQSPKPGTQPLPAQALTELTALFQYPSALGSTVVELRGVLPNHTLTVAKTAFTMLGTLRASSQLIPTQALSHSQLHELSMLATAQSVDD